MKAVYAGLDVGGTYIKGMAFDAAGKQITEASALTRDDGTMDWQNRAFTLMREISEKCPSSPRIGVAAPGLPSQDGQSISFMPGRLHGLEKLNWGNALNSAVPVPVLNDAQAALLGEIWVGAGRGSRNVVLLTLGTGVGGAAMVDGHILRGNIRRAGHLGHVSLDPTGPPDITNTPGSLEDAIGGHTLAKRSGGKFKETRELVTAIRNGSKEAILIWQKSIRALAAAIAGFINVLDPEIVIIGGGIADANEQLFTPLASELDQMEWRPGGARVRLAKALLGKTAGATGAAYAAKLQAENETASIQISPNQ